MSRAELAEAVNAWLWQSTDQRFELDGHHVSKYERGVVRFPIALYRAALRAVLRVDTDVELGFEPPARHRATPGDDVLGGGWDAAGIVDAVDGIVRWSVLNRRDALRGGAAVTGAALTAPLAGWLEPLASWPGRAGRVFSVDEVEALERLVAAFRGWRATGSGLGVSAVAGQLGDVSDRLRGAPDDALTRRVFVAGAELAKIAGAMSFDAGAHPTAQRYYVASVRMAKAGRESSFAAVALAALGRVSFDQGAAGDGLEVIGLAEYGSVGAGSPRLRAMLATRRAWGHAQLGQVYGFHRAVAEAEQSFSDAGPVEAEPRWLGGLDAAELAGVIGARFRDLARHDAAQAEHAVTYIRRALELRDPARARNRALDLIGLARTHLITGEPEHGCTLIGEALPLIDQHQPGRVARKLGDWHHEAAQYATVPAVRDTRTTIKEHVCVSA
jgi:hypothetical protein